MSKASTTVRLHSRMFYAWIAALLFIAFLCAPPTSRADIYRWQDAQGNWHFSDNPPSNVAVERIQTTSRPKPSPETETGLARRETAGQSTDGLFWRIEKTGLRPSYLLGTIHSDDARVSRLRPSVAEALDGADRFVMEMVMDAGALMHYSAALMMADGRDLETVLGKPLFDKVTAAMQDYGLPAMDVRQLKPWAVMALLSMPKPAGGMILDLALYQRAVLNQKPVTGLETLEEQLAVFEGMSLQDQITLLEMTLDRRSDMPAMFEKLIQAYLADDLSRIKQLAEHHLRQADDPAVKRFMFRLNERRNERMAQRMLPYLASGNSFIAVGALHLAGDNGILERLRRSGFDCHGIK